MSEAVFKAEFDAGFFGSWGGAMGGIDALYTPPGGAEVTVQVLVDTDVEQFTADDEAPVSHFATVLTFRRAQVEPQAMAVVVVDGQAYRLVQRVGGSDQSLSRWGVQHA